MRNLYDTGALLMVTMGVTMDFFVNSLPYIQWAVTVLGGILVILRIYSHIKRKK